MCSCYMISVLPAVFSDSPKVLQVGMAATPTQNDFTSDFHHSCHRHEMTRKYVGTLHTVTILILMNIYPAYRTLNLTDKTS